MLIFSNHLYNSKKKVSYLDSYIMDNQIFELLKKHIILIIRDDNFMLTQIFAYLNMLIMHVYNVIQ